MASLGWAWVTVLTVAGCGTRTNLREFDGGTACTRNENCVSADPCYAGRCGPNGLCTYVPTAMNFPSDYSQLGIAADVVSYQGHATGLFVGATDRMTGRTELFVGDFDRNGALNTPRRVGVVEGMRPWDSRIATDGNEIYVLTSVDMSGAARVELRTLSRGPAPQVLAQSGIYPSLGWNGNGLTATFDVGSNCAVAWADAAGNWRSTTLNPVMGCSAMLLPGGTGLPVRIRPAKIVRDAATWFVIDPMGRAGSITQNEAGQQTLANVPLGTASRAFSHSMVVTEGAGKLGAVWIDSPSQTAATAAINFAVLDPMTLAPVATPLRIDVPTASPLSGDPYVMRMDLVYCSSRFIATWVDRTSAQIYEFLADGTRLSGPLMVRGPTAAGVHIRTACVPGGVVQAHFAGVTTIQCTGM